MKSTIILVIIAAMFICIGWFMGGIFTLIFTGIGAALSTISIVKSIIQLRKTQ